jgi:protein SCO1/2
MNRRSYLGSLGIAAAISGAGCLGQALGGGGTDDGTVLDPPEQSRGDPDAVSYPIHGQEFPAFSIRDPIAETTVSLEDFTGERTFLMTYFYASCPDGMCQQLLQHLRRVQEDAAEDGYEDDVGLLAVTFDPARDTAEALRSHGSRMGIEVGADNWHFLRPEDEAAAKSVVSDTFGVPFQRDEGSTDGSTNESAANESAANESAGTDDGYTFTHYSLVHLVNDEGIVERAYPNAATQREAVNTQVIVDETRTVVGVDG